MPPKKYSNTLMPLFKSKRRTARIRTSPIKFSSLRYLALLLLIPLLLFALNSLFRLRHLSCSTPAGECPTEINQILSRYQDQFLFSFNRQQLIADVSQSYPLDDYQIKLSLPGSLHLDLQPQPTLPVSVYLVTQTPYLSFQATSSAIFSSPVDELERFISSQSAQPYSLQSSGQLLPSQEEATTISIIFNHKPTTAQLADFYTLYRQINTDLHPPHHYLFNTNYFFRPDNLPDMVISLSVDLEKTFSALQSISSLSTIKPGARLYDLRFQHPVIR